MSAQDQAEWSEFLDAIGLSAAAQRAYLAVLSLPADAAREAVAAFPAEVVDELAGSHLLHPTSLALTPLRLAVALWSKSLELEIAAVQARAARLSALLPRTAQAPFVEIIEGVEEVRAAFAGLQHSATDEILTFDRGPYFSGPATTISEAQPATLARGVRYRTVYISSALRHESILAAAQQAIQLGEEARAHPDLPLRLIIADAQTALVILPQGGDGELSRPTAVDALLVHESPMLAALLRLFHSVWERSVPLDALAAPLDDGSGLDRRLLGLLASGLADSAIARSLGVSERTVARRVSKLQQRLSAPTRFLLGVQAAKSNLV
ncbi:MAG: LuxR C-terminal-related transcriptional regulator [Propionicimonas sp.]